MLQPRVRRDIGASPEDADQGMIGLNTWTIPDTTEQWQSGRLLQSANQPRPIDRSQYRILIVCAKIVEGGMIRKVLDENLDDIHGRGSQRIKGDEYEYTFGRLAGCQVVVVQLPKTGNTASAAAASAAKAAFSGIEYVFVVGICGVVPRYKPDGEDEMDIHLGDCMIGTRIFQHYHGRQHETAIESYSSDEIVCKLSDDLESRFRILAADDDCAMLEEKMRKNLAELRDTLRSPSSAEYPGMSKDHLHSPENIHGHRNPDESCDDCDKFYGTCGKSCTLLKCHTAGIVQRSRPALDSNNKKIMYHPRLHFGRFGSADSVMKSGRQRDAISRRLDLIGFEMEAAGVASIFRTNTIIVKGACDYADSHKDNVWQKYAAAVAAAGLKALLEQFRPAYSEPRNQDEQGVLHLHINSLYPIPHRPARSVGTATIADGRMAQLVQRICTDSTLLSLSYFPVVPDYYWYSLNTAGWEIYDMMYKVMCNQSAGMLSVETVVRYLSYGVSPPETVQQFCRRLAKPHENILSKSHVLAILYMLHVEVYGPNKTGGRPNLTYKDNLERLSIDRIEELKCFANWKNCACRSECAMLWNFAGRRWGIARSEDSQLFEGCLVYARYQECEAHKIDLNWSRSRNSTFEEQERVAQDAAYKSCYLSWASDRDPSPSDVDSSRNTLSGSVPA